MHPDLPDHREDGVRLLHLNNWIFATTASAPELLTLTDDLRWVTRKSLDAWGRLTKIQDLTTETRFTYDPLGRVTQTRRLLDGVTYVMTQSYDALNRVTAQTFPDNDTVSYTYNEAGWLSSIPGYVSSVSYNARGQQTALTQANGVTTTWTHDPLTFRVTRQQAGPGKISSTLPLVALTRSSKSWTTTETILEDPPPGYAFLYKGGIGVVDGSGSRIGGEASADAWVGPSIGYMKTQADSGTIPLYRTTCYSDTSGSCRAWGLSLTVNGTVVGYLATSAPDTQSASQPFTQSGGLLLQGLGGTASAYLWTAPTRIETIPHTDHYYATTGSPPTGYTGEGTTGYLHQNADSGTVALKRYVNASTGHHYYSTAADYPVGFAEEATLGYIHTSAGTGLTALYRHYNATTKDYLLDTNATPPSGYTLQATVGYVHTTSTGEPTTTTITSLQDLAYTYDARGSITQLIDSVWTGSRNFAYDALNRLTGASGSFGANQTSVSQSYRYDAIGNILEKAGVTYAYSDPSHPSAVTSTSDGRVYTYDANGNMLNGAGRAQSWDADNRLSATTIQGGNSATYGYDSTGTRVKKTTSAGVMLYPFGSYEIDSDGVATKYLQIGIEKVAAKKSNGTTLYYHNDHLGGVNLITDSQGVKVQLVEYDPWGQVSREEGSADPTHRFTGEELDPETGLLYYGGRHYDPTLARFISPDPFIPRPWDPQSLNRYTYVRNNPVNLIDPSGYEDADPDPSAGPDTVSLNDVYSAMEAATPESNEPTNFGRPSPPAPNFAETHPLPAFADPRQAIDALLSALRFGDNEAGRTRSYDSVAILGNGQVAVFGRWATPLVAAVNVDSPNRDPLNRWAQAKPERPTPTMTDVPTMSLQTNQDANWVKWWVKTTGPIDKAAVVAGMVVTGGALIHTGGYLISVAPTLGPIAGSYIAAHGALIALGGLALEASAVVSAYYLFGPGPTRTPQAVTSP